MKPLAKLPPLMGLGNNGASIAALFTSPEFEEFARVMRKASEEQNK